MAYVSPQEIHRSEITFAFGPMTLSGVAMRFFIHYELGAGGLPAGHCSPVTLVLQQITHQPGRSDPKRMN
jgi:hypothetical protein